MNSFSWWLVPTVFCMLSQFSVLQYLDTNNISCAKQLIRQITQYTEQSSSWDVDSSCQSVKKSPAFYWTWIFITVCTRGHSCSSSGTRLIHDMVLPFCFFKFDFNIVFPSTHHMSSKAWCKISWSGFFHGVQLLAPTQPSSLRLSRVGVFSISCYPSYR